MIGVVADSREHAVAVEFFELFKTPWEFYREDRDYEVVLCAREPEIRECTARLVLIYSGVELAYDGRVGLAVNGARQDGEGVHYRGVTVPVYGRSVRFALPDGALESVAHLGGPEGTRVVRLGYDLFGEVAHLLTDGQPAGNAAIPALELHIAILRELIVSSGAALTEIPPVPAGYNFIACLTHDVDHPSIRRHGFDHTTFGFLYRAVAASVRCWRQGRLSGHGVVRNWAAAAKLPFVHLRLARDFWKDFGRYRDLEQGAPSTFFVIPFAGRAGRSGDHIAPHYRKAGYGAADIAAELKELAAAGCEVGTHGIDAWRDSTLGREEMVEVQGATGKSAAGARMHWLYFDSESHAVLEQAGFAYDSTVGYNETIGYRAGTSQAYRPLNARELLELPLHVMDTALFYREHLNLSPAAAKERVAQVVRQTARVGGCVTLNWHDRSIAPERLWGEFYGGLVEELKKQGAWLASAEQVVAWFRQRRAMVFRQGAWEPAPLAHVNGWELPGVQVHAHNGPETVPAGAPNTAHDCVVTAG
jgi:hypothetical protein